VGVDIAKQPRYPFEFHQGDALEYLAKHGGDFDAIHASPPCQAYTTMRYLGKRAGEGAPDLVGSTRDALKIIGVPWIIENVVGAPLINPAMLCGSMFGLGVRRHRLFESSFFILTMECRHGDSWPFPVWGDGRPSRQEVRKAHRPIAVYGDHPQGKDDKTYRCNRAKTLMEGQRAMDIDWMKWKELTQAIPPAYTNFIGLQLLAHLQSKAEPQGVA
jgi:DNA (cytosine-5)-methyltransferase 1